MKCLGIDYGTKRVGVAVSDDDGQMAFPHTVYVQSETLAAEVVALIRRESIGTVVIGESKTTQGEMNDIAKAARVFGDHVHEASGVPIEYMDERFSSGEALRQEKLHRGLTTRENRNVGLKTEGAQDASAATVILQRFLDGRTRHA